GDVRFRAVFEASLDAIGVSRGPEYVISNPAYLRMFGYDTHDELVGRKIIDFIAPEERDRLSEIIARRGLGDAAPREYDTVGLRRDGTRFPMEVRSSTYVEDGARFTLAIIRDITESKRHEDEVARLLIERERLIAELQEQRERMPLACLVTDRDRRLSYWNDAAQRIFGWTRDEVMGRDALALLVPENTRAIAVEAMQRADHGERMAGANVNRTKDGRQITCEWYSVPLPSVQGVPESMMWLAQDVTERRRLEDELRQAQKMDAIGRLAGGVAHDFNNLLTVITGYGEIINQGLDLHHPLRGHAEQMLKAAWRAAQLTRQLLAFGRRQVLQPRVVDLNAIVVDMGNLLRRVIGENIELITEFCPDLGRVRADPGQIEQVLMNFALNARDAMPDGGRLTIATANRALDHDTPGLRAGRWVLLRVVDTGHGMDATVKARLFEPFFTTKPPGKGTGLGLATAYGIVTQSGGAILVDSEPSHGTTFTVALPRSDAGESTATPANGALVAESGHGTVLLIEDEPQLRDLVKLTLEGAGYELIEAADGEQGLRVLERIGGVIDLVITDVIMPRIGGPEVVARMAGFGLDVPVLYMSGYAEGRLVDQALAEGRARFLEKPFTGEALLRAVHAALTGRDASGDRPPAIAAVDPS
ncbi:MAG TPA: PAS domain S-box protein, partial [Planctomycetota bacterium]|nr:PAS domain S-box protein [Planctomycetota bacterium]